MTPARLVATGLGSGLLPEAPGTWASLLAIPPAFLLHWLGSFPLLAAATLGLFAAGLWAVRAVSGGMADPDRPEITVDEIVGQWLALWPLSAGLWLMGAAPETFPWPGWVGAFLLFRFFDILKPPPVRWADRLATPLGVMLDDVLAGLMAAAVLLAGAAVAHGWLA